MFPELLTFIEFSFLSVILLAAFRYAGFAGLCVLTSLSVLIANIQVLREIPFCFQQAPIALGSIVSSFVFLGTDVITEHYGPKLARLSVLISFVAQIVFIMIMQLTLAYPPQSDLFFAPLQTIFTPMPRLFIASIVAFLVSQMLDVYLFQKIKQRFTAYKWLWLRSFVSTSIANLVDSIIFSALAWYILAPSPCSLNKLIWTYILGAYVFKVFINAWSTPIIYLSHKVKRLDHRFGTNPVDTTMQD